MKKILLGAATLLAGLYCNAQDTIKPYFLNSGEIINAGIKFYDEAKYDSAIVQFDKIHPFDTNYTWACYEKCLALVANEKYQQAIELGEYNIRNGYIDAQQFNLIGAAYDQLGQFDKAFANYDQALKLFPMRNELHFNRATVYEVQKKYAENFAALKETLRINPFNLSAHVRMGKMAAKQGLYTQALLSFVTFLIIEPSGEKSLNTLTTADQIAGMTWKELNSIEKAIPQEFKEIDFIFSNRIALNKQYETASDFTYPIIKQLYAVFEQMRKNKNFGEGYWATYYGPFYKEIIKSVNFSDLSLLILASVDDNEIQRPLNRRLTEVKELREKLVERWYKLHEKVLVQRDGKPWEANISIDEEGFIIDGLVTVDATGKKNGYQEIYYRNGGLEGKGNAVNDLKDGNWTFFYETGEKMSEFVYHEDKREGPFRIWYQNGELKEVGTMQDDVLNGEWKSYYPSGSLEAEENYNNGKQEGIGKKYFRTGQLEFEYNMKDNKLNGRMKEYYSTGQLFSEVDYVDGEKNGVERKYFIDGTLSLEQYFKEDMIEGPMKSYYSDGKIESEGNASMDNAVGVWKYYYPNGKIKLERNINEDGEDHGPWLEYGYDGKLFKTFDFQKNELKSVLYQDKQGKVVYQAKVDRAGGPIEEYNEFGVLTAEGTLYPEYREGKWSIYNNYGVLTRTIPYEKGKVNGEVVEYFSNGMVETNTSYKDDEYDGFYRDRFLNGNNYVQGNFVEGKKWMEWIGYNNDGTVASKRWYENNTESHINQFNDIFGKTRLIEYMDEYNMIKALTYLDSTGKILDSVSFKNGNGDFMLKGYNGEKYYQGSYKSGLRHGIFRWYYPNGQVETEGQYENERRKELWTWYHPNGKVKARGAYLYGQMTGKWERFDFFGNQTSETNYAFDKKNGKFYSLHSDGTVEYEQDYVDGKPHGNWSITNPQGKKIISFVYVNGTLVGYSVPQADGTAGEIVPIKKGTVEIRVKYPTGEPAMNCDLVGGEFQGAYELFYGDGKPWVKNNYRDGQLSGQQTIYYADGKVLAQSTMVFDRLSGPVVEYYSNGKVKEEGTHHLDARHGVFRMYDANGKQLGAYQYYDDNIIKEVK